MSPSIREEHIVISSFDVGASGRLEAASAMRHFQEAASHHATQLGVGIEQLGEQHVFWVLTHLQIKAVRWPEMNEEIVIQTWPKALKGLYTTRDFLMLTLQGETLISATSAWIMVNSEKKRPIRPAGWINPKAFVPHKDALTPFPDVIPDPDVTYKTVKRTVQYSDLDLNRHVNNTRYVEWIMDALAPMHRNHQLTDLNLHFIKEFTADEEAAILISEAGSNNSRLVSIFHPEENQPGCLAQVTFREKSQK